MNFLLKRAIVNIRGEGDILQKIDNIKPQDLIGIYSELAEIVCVVR